MKTEFPPWVAVAIIVVVALIIGFLVYRGSGPGRQAQEMEAAIKASAAVGGAAGPGMEGGPPGPPDATAPQTQ